MNTNCVHCLAPAEIADQLCLPCAADAFTARMFFAEYRFLSPGEKRDRPHEARSSRTSSDWTKHDPSPTIIVDEAERGLFRTALRLAGQGHRIVDPDEPLHERDIVTTGAPRERPMYAKFPLVCACPSKKTLVLDPALTNAEICETCGRVWHKNDSSLAEVDYQGPIPPKVTDCSCQSAHVSDVETHVYCKFCKQRWLKSAYAERHSLYPDLVLHDLPSSTAYTLPPEQLKALDDIIVDTVAFGWWELRGHALLVFPAEDVERIDREVEAAISNTSTDPVVIAKREETLQLLNSQLKALQDYVDDKERQALRRRHVIIDQEYKSRGASWESPPEDYKRVEAEIKQLLTPLLSSEGMYLGIYGVTGRELRDACNKALEADGMREETRSLAKAFLENISPHELVDRPTMPKPEQRSAPEWLLHAAGKSRESPNTYKELRGFGVPIYRVLTVEDVLEAEDAQRGPDGLFYQAEVGKQLTVADCQNGLYVRPIKGCPFVEIQPNEFSLVEAFKAFVKQAADAGLTHTTTTKSVSVSEHTWTVVCTLPKPDSIK